MQTILDDNYISIYGGNLDLTRSSFLYHFLLIGSLSLIVMIFFSFQNFYVTAIGIATEILIFISLAIGSFTSDFFWLIKNAIYLLPASILDNMGNWIIIDSPGIGESTLIPVIAPLSGIALTYGGNVFYKFLMEQKDKLYLKQTFGTYISPALIDQMFEEKKAPQLGGIQGIHTAFFSDIQNFSTFSEKLTPERLVELLNEYLTAMTDILLTNKGTLDKYIGDAIVAFFGAPVELEDQEYLACLTCCQMNDKLEILRKKWQSEGDKWPDIVHNMRHRIGVNCGSLVTGNMGSEMRMNYTMIGDAVNLTSRLESGAKQYGIETQVGEKIYTATKDRMTFRMLDYAIVKGRSEPERTYELISEKGKEPAIYNELLPLWDEAIRLYRNQQWDKAIKAFNKCDKLEEDFIGRPTTPCKVYITRCEELKADSLSKDWDGSWILTSK
jgi:adenylate cyclase